MAWNTEETRRRLKEAALVEFAEHGLAGTRMDRIAARAGINKERLYNYFGDKERLFTTVLTDEMIEVGAAVPLTSLAEEDIGEYAGRCFDYHATHPHFARLLLWEALAYGEQSATDEPRRAAHYRAKVEAVRTAQAQGLVATSPDAPDVVFMVWALAAWWWAVPQVARMMTGEPAEGDELPRRRAAVVAAARRMAAPTH